MENQHRQIAGCRDLSQHEIDLMNAIKAKGEEMGALLNQLDTHLELQRLAADQQRKEGKPNESTRLGGAQPYCWLAIARTDMQTGIMAAVRAVAQPTTFLGDSPCSSHASASGGVTANRRALRVAIRPLPAVAMWAPETHAIALLQIQAAAFRGQGTRPS